MPTYLVEGAQTYMIFAASEADAIDRAVAVHEELEGETTPEAAWSASLAAEPPVDLHAGPAAAGDPFGFKALGAAHLDDAVVRFDFGSSDASWAVLAVVRCDECRQVIGYETSDHAIDCPNGELDVDDLGSIMPVANHYYPCRVDDLDAAARAIVGLPLVIVHVAGEDDDWVAGLALTGGGMDLSWEIAEAYVRLGHLPPVWLRLPAMADKYATERTIAVLAAVLRSHTVAIQRHERVIEELMALESQLTPLSGKV